MVDYVRLSFILFGPKLVSFFLTYFVIIGSSFAAAFLAFRKLLGVLAIFVIYAVALFVLFNSNLLDVTMVGILDPRFLSTLALVPTAHIAFAMLVPLRPAPVEIGLVTVQSAILVFGCWIRSSALWAFLALLALALFIAA